MRHFAKGLMILWAILASAGIAGAQEGEIREFSSPFTEEFDYRVGRTLDLKIRIDGLSWRLLRIGAGDEADWTAGDPVKTSITCNLENLTDTSLALTVIILLEDERGRPLERVGLKRIKIGPGRSIEKIQNIKVDGGSLSDTAKIYIFAEVE